MTWRQAGISMSNWGKDWADIFRFTFLRHRFADALRRDSSQDFWFSPAALQTVPYAVYYQIDAGSVVAVYRVLDCRQNPRKTFAALKSGG